MTRRVAVLMGVGVVLLCNAAALHAEPTMAEYTNLLAAFEAVRTSGVFPVPGRSFDDIESAFGPRLQISSGDRYDWHRGLDVDGTTGETVVAAQDGIYWDYKQYSGGGFTVILRHQLPSTVTYNGRSCNYYYTFYMHLFDDQIASNSIGTDDIIADWTKRSTVVTAGQQIAEMGASGSPAGGGSYAPHLHLDCRIGTMNSLQYQLANTGTVTQYGFDPHMNPMLMFEPYLYSATGGPSSYVQNLYLETVQQLGSNMTVRYEISNDDMPVLNRIRVAMLATGDTEVVAHELDYNRREGFVATNTAALDTQDTNFPYISPVRFGVLPDVFRTRIILPSAWTDAAATSDVRKLRVEVADIWDNTEAIEFPFPAPNVSIESIGVGASGNQVAWGSVPGQVYQLRHSSNLTSWTALPDSVVTTPARETLSRHTDTSHADDALGYYRIMIREQ